LVYQVVDYTLDVEVASLRRDLGLENASGPYLRTLLECDLLDTENQVFERAHFVVQLAASGVQAQEPAEFHENNHLIEVRRHVWHIEILNVRIGDGRIADGCSGSVASWLDPKALKVLQQEAVDYVDGAPDMYAAQARENLSIESSV
jgi:hypothetical protein